ncbi:MFS transporter [Marinospirillum sp.]|uniref:MFS transporter n=1 Tax=Marinospirillum sp. TaxID=2183934 RepID=UPI0025BF29AB|nr:MFS transporter [Marinospirillum sp.]
MLAFGFITIFWGNLGQSFFISWYGAGIQASLNLDAASYGMLYGLATLGSGITVLLLGGLIDRWPLRRFVVFSALLLLLATASLAWVSSSLMLVCSFYLLRLAGQGLMPHTAQTTMARYFNHQRGKALSLSASGVPAGEVLLPLLAVVLLGWLGWQQSWWVFSASVLLIYLPLALWLLRRAPQADELRLTPASVASGLGRLALLRDWRFWCVVPAVLSGPFFITGIFIQQGFILQQQGWSAAWLAQCFIAYGVIHWVTALSAGQLVDRFTARRLLPWAQLPLLAALLVLALFSHPVSALVFMALLGASVGLSSPIGTALWAELYGTGRLGSIRSMMVAFMVLATAAAPWLMGGLIEQGWSLTEIFLLGSGGVVLVLMLLLPVTIHLNR